MPEDGERKYPYPLFGVDLSGAVKVRTLEYFAYSQDWERSRSLLKSAVASDWEMITPETKAVQMRLLRYTRQGLLERRKVGRAYEYKITPKGEQRLVYLMRSRGLLDPANARSEHDEGLRKVRLELAIWLQEGRILRDKVKLNRLLGRDAAGEGGV